MGSRPCNLIKERRKNNQIGMVNRRLFLVTFIVFCAIFEGTMALKCYDGLFINQPGARQRESRLYYCGRNEDLCLSVYAKTDLEFKNSQSVFAGAWQKRCVGRSAWQIEEFDGDFSERCIESEKHLTSGTFIVCICTTDGCNQEKELDVKSNP